MAERLRKLKALQGREAKNAQGTKQAERLSKLKALQKAARLGMLKALSRPRG